MIHLALSRVMSSCHAARLNWSFRKDTYSFLNMHIHLNCYSFAVLFPYFCRASFLFSQALPIGLWTMCYLGLALSQARRSQARLLIILMLFSRPGFANFRFD